MIGLNLLKTLNYLGFKNCKKILQFLNPPNNKTIKISEDIYFKKINKMMHFDCLKNNLKFVRAEVNYLGLNVVYHNNDGDIIRVCGYWCDTDNVFKNDLIFIPKLKKYSKNGILEIKSRTIKSPSEFNEEYLKPEYMVYSC